MKRSRKGGTPSATSGLQVGQIYQAEITRFDHMGAGIAHIEGKTVFIERALPNETVTFRCTQNKKHYARGVVETVLQPSAQRQAPLCPYFGQCGGCQLQHLDDAAQLQYKRDTVVNLLQRYADLAQPPTPQLCAGEAWGYRRRARLSVKVTRTAILLGFKAAHSHRLVEIAHCAVLEPALSTLLTPLKALLTTLQDVQQLETIDLIAAAQDAIVLLHVQHALCDASVQQCVQWAQQQGCRIALCQSGHPAEFLSVDTTAPQLTLHMPSGQNVALSFALGDFIQNNAAMNQRMLEVALDLLDLQPDERAMDLFCGMGNFSIPMALTGAEVIAVEGSQALLQQASDNAQRNNCYTLSFHCADLFADAQAQWDWWQPVDKLLLDPPRDGAKGICQHIKELKPTRIVYVSCDPASLARDTALLAEQGYHMTQLVLVDMFPQTYHIESIALFESA